MPNVKDLLNDPKRIIPVSWDASGASQNLGLRLSLRVTDRMGLLKDVTVTLSDAGSTKHSFCCNTSGRAGRPSTYAFLGFYL